MNGEKKNISFYPHPPTWAAVLVSILLVVLVVYIGSLIRNELREYTYIGRSNQQIYTISINGEGKVTAIPDIATVSFGIETQRNTVAAAQQENTEKMNALISQVKDLGIADADIQTVNYNIYPRYDYLEGRQILRGYTVNQNVSVKIRDLEKVSGILDLAGQAGVNQLGGLAFTIDEPETLRQEARLKALAQAKQKAEALAEAAGVKLGKLVSFNESGPVYPGPVYRDYAFAEGLGGGGGAPAVEPGSQEIIISVNVIYEVL